MDLTTFLYVERRPYGCSSLKGTQVSTEMQEREQKLLENLLEREPNQWNFALT